MSTLAPAHTVSSAATTQAHVAFADFARNGTRRYVVPPLILSIAVALAAVASFLALALPFEGAVAENVAPLIERFLGNSFSRAIVVLFLGAGIYGLLQLLGTRVDRHRLDALRTQRPLGQFSWLALLAGRPARALVPDALAWNDSLGEDPHEIADRFSVQHRRSAERGLVPLRFAVWVLPLLGFIGTVVGIARSIVGLEAVIAAGAGGQMSDGLLTVLGGLQFAFDTTLLGLLAVIPVMMLQMILDSREGEITEKSHHMMLALMTSTPGSMGPVQGESVTEQ